MTTLKDPFSEKMFGSTEVTVTTTTLSDSEEEEEMTRAQSIAKQKHLKIEIGKAEQMLNRMRSIRDKKRSRRMKKGKTRSKREKHSGRR